MKLDQMLETASHPDSTQKENAETCWFFCGIQQWNNIPNQLKQTSDERKLKEKNTWKAMF